MTKKANKENKCSVCFESDLITYGEKSWQEKKIKYKLLKCCSCGTVFTFPLPSNKVLENFYKTNFSYKWYEDHLYAKIKDSKLRFEEYKEVLGKSVLDFGGGIGYLSETLRKKGFESLTYDPYLSSPLKKKKWDTIITLHAAEHSNDIDSFFKKIKSLLKINGNLIMAVPNLDGLGYKKYDMDFVWAQPPFLHIYHFSTNGIINALKRNGFNQIEVLYHDRWDANIYSDVIKRNFFSKCDGLWGKKYFHRFSAYRKIVALIATLLRFYALKKAKNINKNPIDRCELEIRAKYAG